ncbi:uncharacterized protein PAF06_014239 [Gastrophryne carolinensis]
MGSKYSTTTTTTDSNVLSEEECKLANEAKQRTLNIFKDALKKKDSLLVGDQEKIGIEINTESCPLISTALVTDLITQLEEVTFRKGKYKTGTIAYVRPEDGKAIVYLCEPFWKQGEFLGDNSRPETLIHEVAHLLGYNHTIKENTAKVEKTPQHKLWPVSACNIENAFSVLMNHSENYKNGSYCCCGETSRDTVCENSLMGSKIRYNYIKPAVAKYNAMLLVSYLKASDTRKGDMQFIYMTYIYMTFWDHLLETPWSSKVMP